MPKTTTADQPSTRWRASDVVWLTVFLSSVLVIAIAGPRHIVKYTRECLIDDFRVVWNAQSLNQQRPVIHGLKDAAKELPAQPDLALKQIDDVIAQLENQNARLEYCDAATGLLSKGMKDLSGREDEQAVTHTQPQPLKPGEEDINKWKVIWEQRLLALRKLRAMLAESKADLQKVVQIKATLEWETIREDRL